MTVEEVQALGQAIRAEIGKAVIGHDATVDLLLVALFAGGHILLEGPPGTAKTLLAHAFAKTVGLEFGRIQFTPDLMPGDIIGANLFNFQTSTFTLTQGPIFTELLLADEINRTSPKTQAALLEAMQERTVTIDGESLALSNRFTVVATQNPIEQQGVYPLPEAQLDRFLFKQTVSYPTAEEERRIVADHGARSTAMSPADWGSRRAPTRRRSMRRSRRSRRCGWWTRSSTISSRWSAGRAMSPTWKAAPRRGRARCWRGPRARAALDGRDFVIPDDVKTLAPALLRHRLILSPAAEISGRAIEDVVAQIIETIEAPR
ncbi:MoxR family ATPase [Sphingomonas aurantiaca]